MSESFAAALKFARESKGMSARGLSQAAGLSDSYVSKLEREDLEVSFKAFVKLAAILDLSKNEIMWMIANYNLDES